MTQTAANVRVGTTETIDQEGGIGGIFIAPVGTPAPLDGLPENLDLETWTNVGYISDDGVTEGPDTSTESIKAWENGDEVRVIQTEHSLTYAFEMIETFEVSLELYYGHYDDGRVDITGKQLPHHAWVILERDGDHAILHYIGDGQITERAEITRSSTDAVKYGVTVSCYPVEGVKAQQWHTEAVAV